MSIVHRRPAARHLAGALLLSVAPAALMPALAQETAPQTVLETAQEAAPAASPDAVRELAPITVEATGESADGPVEGVFATRSATATKTDAPIAETPQSITVVPAAAIEARNANSVAEALRYATGVTTENRGGSVSRYDMFTVRGFQVNREYLDGLQLQYNGWYAIPQIDTSMIERVEVLKGPASVLFGNSPPGGLVNLVSKRPQDTASGKVSVGIGTNKLREATVDTTGPLDDEGEFSYRLIAKAHSKDGQAKTTEAERVLVAPSLTWQPSDRTSLTVLTHYQRDPKSGSYGAVPSLGSAFDNPLGQLDPDFYDGDVNWEEFDRTQIAAGYEFEHSFDDTWTVRQNFRYLETDIDYRSVYPTALAGDNRTLGRASIYSDERTKSFAVDNQIQAKFTTGPIEHTLLAGLDYWKLNSDAEIGYGAAPTLDLFAPNNNQPIASIAPSRRWDFDHHQTGIYVQEQLKWGGLTVLAGGRKDWYERDDTELLSGTPADLEQDNFSGRIGALYRFENGIAPYVSYAESFEPQSGTDFAGTPFKPTTGQQTEVGVKYLSLDESVMVTVAAFDLYKQNVTTRDPANPAFNIQTGEIRSRGVEVEGHLDLTNGLGLSAFYTFLDTEYTKDNTGLVGKTPVWVAKHNASLWADYTFDQDTIPGLKVGAGARYTDGSWVDAANSRQLDPFTLFDASIEYDLGALTADLEGTSVRLNGSNITDKRHVAGCFSSGWCWFGEERAVTLTVAHEW
ncbi:TonB-dependent siderophore receptor [Pyruvatibacter mobilis]|uniref:TonB-dependent siderophore receptor n=1 Tax=Pyruvatibacter mobilis TaxID=1712261 RepID=UPI003BACD053